MPDPIIRDIPLIQRYSRHNEAEDAQFRVFLKEQAPISNAEMDTLVGKLTEEVWGQIDCTKCANCCKTLSIVLDEEDIARLSARQNLTPKAFGKKYTRVDHDGTRLFYSTPCPMLSGDGRCTVYEDRPKACRDFPFLHEKNFRSRSFAMMDNTAVCPIVFNVWKRLKMRLQFRKRQPGKTIG